MARERNSGVNGTFLDTDVVGVTDSCWKKTDAQALIIEKRQVMYKEVLSMKSPCM